VRPDHSATHQPQPKYRAVLLRIFAEREDSRG
jgi:hypothetical protein